jgi:hypothetical protein
VTLKNPKEMASTMIEKIIVERMQMQSIRS